MTNPADLPARWRERAAELAPYSPAAAEAFTRAAMELDDALRDAADAPLTLAEAAAESGYSADRLRHMVAAGDVPNAGMKGSPRIRRSDLPRRPRRDGVTAGFDLRSTAARLSREEPLDVA